MLDYPIVLSQSKWDSVADWKVARAKGARATVIRAGSIDATTGECYEDYQLGPHLEAAQADKAPVALYWYFRPRLDPMKQAQFFIGLFEKYRLPACTPWCTDVEEPGIDPDIAAAAVWEFNSIMLGLDTTSNLIYTRPEFFDKCIAQRDWDAVAELYVARFNLLIAGPWADGKYVPRDWTKWTMWQFEDNAPAVEWGYNPGAYNPHNIDPATGKSRGYSAECELSYFKGSEAELLEYFGDQYPEQPEPPTLEELQEQYPLMWEAIGDLQEAVSNLQVKVNAQEQRIAELEKFITINHHANDQLRSDFDRHVHAPGGVVYPPAPTGLTDPDTQTAGPAPVQ